MKRKRAPSYPVSVFVAGDPNQAQQICCQFCDEEGLCVTVTPTTYVYTGGEEAGVIVGLINYPRFPAWIVNALGEHDAMIMRGDRGKALAVIPLETLLELLQ